MSGQQQFLHPFHANVAAVAATIGRGAAAVADQLIGALASRQHGLVARTQLLALGIGRGAITNRIGRGLLRPVHPGVYAVGHEALGWHGRLQADLLYGGPDASLARRTAAALLRFRPRSGAMIELISERRIRSQPGLRTLRATLPHDELVMVEGLVATRPARTLLDLAAVLDSGQLERSLTEIERLRLTDRVPLELILERYPKKLGRSKLTALCARRSNYRHRTKSDLEQLFLGFCDAHDIPRPRTNFDMPANGFNVGFEPLEVDAIWIAERVIVELDARSTHGTLDAFERDRARDRALSTAGWRVLRVTERAMAQEPALLVRQLTGLLRGVTTLA